MISLFEFLNYPAGPTVGKQVYSAFCQQYPNIIPAKRKVKTEKYDGWVDLYPEEFLAEYFKPKPEENTQTTMDFNKPVSDGVMKLFFNIQKEYNCGGSIIEDEIEFYTLDYCMDTIVLEKNNGEDMMSTILRACLKAKEYYKTSPEKFISRK